MKRLITILFLFNSALAQTVINIPAPSGVNDYVAIKTIADTVNAHAGNYIVNFTTNGQYKVRPPYLDAYPDSVQVNTQWNVFHLINCSNVIINANGATIKLMDSVPLGVKPGGSGNAYIGTVYRFTGCTGITLNDANADGNQNGMRLLGTYGVGINPYELEHDGLIVHNSRDVNILNCRFKNFSRDGIMFLQDTGIGYIPNNNNYIYNTVCDSNGRDGFSWTGGDSLLVRSCTFIKNAKGRISENPAAGMDIEPERGAHCTNGRFVSCIFEDNEGYGITSSAPTTSRYITFDSCKIRGGHNYAFYTQCPFYKFYNTEFYGVILLNFSPNSGGDSSAYFYKCTFTDSLRGYVNVQTNTSTYMMALADSTRFSHCNWYSYRSAFVYSDNKGARFDTCNFYAMFRTPSSWGANCFVLSRTTFTQCKFYKKLYPDYSGLYNPEALITLIDCSFHWIPRYYFLFRRRYFF